MFGLVKRARLLDAERRVVDIRLVALRAERAGEELMRELEIEKKLRASAEAERDRLQLILTAHPIEPAELAPAKAPEPEPAEPIRVLTGLEVVARATLHRNAHHKG